MKTIRQIEPRVFDTVGTATHIDKSTSFVSNGHYEDIISTGPKTEAGKVQSAKNIEKGRAVIAALTFNDNSNKPAICPDWWLYRDIEYYGIHQFKRNTTARRCKQ